MCLRHSFRRISSSSVRALQSDKYRIDIPQDERPRFLQVLRQEEKEFNEELEREFDQDCGGEVEPFDWASRASFADSTLWSLQFEQESFGYAYVDWERLRATIVDDCVKVMAQKPQADLSEALARWNGMVGNRLVAAVVGQLKTADDAFAFFKWSGQQHSYKHDAISYGALMKLVVSVDKDHKRAVTIFKHAQRAQVAPDANMVELLVEGLCSLGEFREAIQQLKGAVETVTPAACTSILNAMFKAGQAQEAYQYFKSLGCFRFPPGCVLYNCVLEGLCNAGMMVQAVEVFDKTQARNAESYTTMINGFRRQKDVEQAQRYTELMAQAERSFSA